MTVEALKDVDVTRKDAERAKNMFALGLLCWLYHRPTEGTIAFLKKKFASKPELAAGQHHRLRGRLELWRDHRGLLGLLRDQAGAGTPRPLPQHQWQPRLAYGLLAASWRSSLPLFLGSYPITPASDILHELSKHKRFGVRTFQAEDEIAGVGAALGAAFGGHLGVTTTSGPGLALKAETIGLAVSLELPLVVCDIQRGGPSTGLANQDRAVRPAAGAVRPQR